MRGSKRFLNRKFVFLAGRFAFLIWSIDKNGRNISFSWDPILLLYLDISCDALRIEAMLSITYVAVSVCMHAEKNMY